MTEKVKNILKNYGGDNPGTLSNLARILNHGELKGTGKLVIYPVDQGFEHGPDASFLKNPPSYDPFYHCQLARDAACSAYAAPFGFIDSVAREFSSEIPLILKVNNSESLYKNPKSPLPSITSGVEEALRLGCCAIGFTIYPGSEDSLSMYEDLVKLARSARKVGLPTVVWSYPRGGSLSKQGEQALDIVAYATHIACQLGAHIVKVKPPADFFERQKLTVSSTDLDQRVSHVMRSAFKARRIVIFSGGPSKDTEELLEEVRLLAKGGAFGSIVGRNVFQRSRESSLELLKKIMAIYKEFS
ncbi:MAG: class I fructose-bisphosphate aldolase [Bdellovibrionales bacterium]|nr:class I fructose-bisphosphate aldolase [Bdellovibrionales bacterium]